MKDDHKSLMTPYPHCDPGDESPYPPNYGNGTYFPPELTKTVTPMQQLPASERQAGGQHYKNFPIQPAVYAEKNGLNFMEGNVVKYVSRHDKKDGAKDIAKAIHMLEMILEVKYNTTYQKVVGNNISI